MHTDTSPKILAVAVPGIVASISSLCNLWFLKSVMCKPFPMIVKTLSFIIKEEYVNPSVDSLLLIEYVG